MWFPSIIIFHFIWNKLIVYITWIFFMIIITHFSLILNKIQGLQLNLNIANCEFPSNCGYWVYKLWFTFTQFKNNAIQIQMGLAWFVPICQQAEICNCIVPEPLLKLIPWTGLYLHTGPVIHIHWSWRNVEENKGLVWNANEQIIYNRKFLEREYSFNWKKIWTNYKFTLPCPNRNNYNVQHIYCFRNGNNPYIYSFSIHNRFTASCIHLVSVCNKMSFIFIRPKSSHPSISNNKTFIFIVEIGTNQWMKSFMEVILLKCVHDYFFSLLISLFSIKINIYFF